MLIKFHFNQTLFFSSISNYFSPLFWASFVFAKHQRSRKPHNFDLSAICHVLVSVVSSLLMHAHSCHNLKKHNYMLLYCWQIHLLANTYINSISTSKTTFFIFIRKFCVFFLLLISFVNKRFGSIPQRQMNNEKSQRMHLERMHTSKATNPPLIPLNEGLVQKSKRKIILYQFWRENI